MKIDFRSWSIDRSSKNQFFNSIIHFSLYLYDRYFHFPMIDFSIFFLACVILPSLVARLGYFLGRNLAGEDDKNKMIIIYDSYEIGLFSLSKYKFDWLAMIRWSQFNKKLMIERKLKIDHWLMSKSFFFADFSINLIFLMIDFRFKLIMKIGMIGITILCDAF